jgi:DNA polymerase-3 subunit gamma/tau
MAKDPQTLPLLEVSEQARQRYTEQAQRADTRFLYSALRVMNQCDINYRQSSNKRLLVELTLIEIAQITQPADAPGSGLRPRRLKSLFKQLIQQARPKQTAPQVAVAAPKNHTQSKADAQSAQAQQPAKKVTLKTSSLGLSWNKLKPQNRKMEILPGTPGVEDKREQEFEGFTQDDLALQWLSMCNRMPQKLSGIATRMKNMTPVILEIPALEVVVPNEIVKDEMELIKGSIVSTLRKYLHNNAITLTIRVAEKQEREVILTRKQQFLKMVDDNPAVGRLCELFDLVLT